MSISKAIDSIADGAKELAKNAKEAAEWGLGRAEELLDAVPDCQPPIARVQSICRYAKPGDQVPLPWDLWEAYSNALRHAKTAIVLDAGGTHPLRLPVEVKFPEVKKSIIAAHNRDPREKFQVCVFPVIK